MTEDIRIKYIINTKLEEYNRRQAALYINSFVLKFFILACLLLAMVILGFFLIPILTPLLLETDDQKGYNAVSIGYSLLMVIVILIGTVFYFYMKGKYKKKAVREGHFFKDGPIDTRIDYNALIDLEMSSQKAASESSFLLFRMMRIDRAFAMLKSLFGFAFKIIFMPVSKPQKLIFDYNKLKLSISLIQKLKDAENNYIEYNNIVAAYQDFSQNWLNSTLNNLSNLDIISLSETENGKKLIFLKDIDFFTPEKQP